MRWTQPRHTHCSAMYNDSMCYAELSHQQEGSQRCQKRPICAVLKLLFTLFDYYSNYFNHYTYYFKTRNCDLGENSLQKSAHLAGAEAAQHQSSSSTTKRPCPTAGPIRNNQNNCNNLLFETVHTSISASLDLCCCTTSWHTFGPRHCWNSVVTCPWTGKET